VEDNLFNRQGLIQYLHLKGYETLEAGDAQTAVALAERHRPATAIVDIVLPPTPTDDVDNRQSVGLDVVRRLKVQDQSMGVIIFSAHEDRAPDVWAMVREGHLGLAYLIKGIRADAIIETLDLVRSGQVLIEPDEQLSANQMSDDLLGLLSDLERPYVQHAANLFPTLSPREQEVAWRVAGAHENQSIALSLDMAPKTVESHIRQIYTKLGLTEAIKQAPTLRKATLLAKACILFQVNHRRYRPPTSDHANRPTA
jgi:DNA-binding NarL/FixJ family response regulator